MRNRCRVSLIAAVGVFCVWMQMGTLARADGAQPLASDIPDFASLISLPSNHLAWPGSDFARELLDWPPAAVVESQKAHTNRSKAIPPAYSKQGMRDAKPIRLGALTPEAAAGEAEDWIRRILKPEWVPADLASRLKLLQRSPASQSVIVCRYRLSGHAIQITQSRAFIWVALQPPPMAGQQLASQAALPFALPFTTYFLHGDDMTSVPRKEVAVQSGPHLYVAEPSATENWWGWRACCANEKAVAVLLSKQSEDSARNPRPDDPWF